MNQSYLASKVSLCSTESSWSHLSPRYDATSEVEDEAIGLREEFVLREQEMLNAYRSGQYARAMTIALEIDQPLRLRGLLQKLVEEDSLAHHVSQVVFSPKTLTRLLLYVRDWNTNARFCGVAQAVLEFVLANFSFADIRRAVREGGAEAATKGNAGSSSGVLDKQSASSDSPGERVVLSDLLAGLVAYSERHLKRAARVYQSSFLVEYTLGSMQKLLPQQELVEAADQPQSATRTDATAVATDTTTAADGLDAAHTENTSSDSSSDSDSDSGDDESSAVPAKPASPAASPPKSATDATSSKPRRRQRRRSRKKK